MSYDVNINTTTTYYLLPVVQGCVTNTTRFPLTVTLNTIPVVNNITIKQCEDEVMDGIANFNLSDYNDAIVASSLNNIVVNFYETMDLSIPIDDENYTNQYNNQTVYAHAFNTITNCSAIAEVLLSVNVIVTNNAEITTCDDFDETGVANFDLTLADSQILNGEVADITILGYFETFSNALLQENQLNTAYTNTEPYNQTIYVRLEQNGSCYSIGEVRLIVEYIPNLLEDEEVYYCVNSFPETITLKGEIIDDIPNNYYYSWSTGETTINIDVNEIGTYEVLVTKPFGCTNKRTIVVLPSSIAVVESVGVSDLSENNLISVLVSGSGDYLYALDNENFNYQESNTFENVSSGIHTVYIKDTKAECGIVGEDVSVLGFPKLFTPNGDTINDTWQIRGFLSEFETTANINIFNRYGKLVASLNSNHQKWDGTHNGNLLPNDDYWFVAKLVDGRTYKGHFTLKR